MVSMEAVERYIHSPGGCSADQIRGEITLYRQSILKRARAYYVVDFTPNDSSNRAVAQKR